MPDPKLQSAIEMLKELIDLEDGLTDWEVKFVDGLARKLEAMGPDFRMTDVQIAKVGQIHTDRIG